MSQDISEIAFLVIAGTVVFLILISFIVLILMVHRNRQLANRQKMTLMKTTYEKELANSQLEIQEETLRYVGREIHDNLGQILSLVKLNLNAHSEQKVNYAKELLGDAIQDIRSLSKTLNLDWAKDISLLELIERECHKLDKSGGVITRLVAEESEYEFSVQQKIIVFRVFQECLNNIIKHAQASHISISLAGDSSALRLKITDDGKGFDVDKAEKGSGLINMKSRVELLKGIFAISSKAGIGTEVLMIIPYQN